MLSSAMPAYDFAAPRLFVEADLAEDGELTPGKSQQNYLVNVLRLRAGRRVLLFNGRDGEFEASLEADGKRALLRVGRRLRMQTPPSTLRWLFAPLKHARLDYMVQKAVELGVGSIEPVLTSHTQVSRVNLDRMRANVVEAAEQCGILSAPRVEPERRLAQIIDSWDSSTRLIFCDEGADVADPVAALSAVPEGAFAVLIGPEGGFDESERKALLALPAVTRLTLGPRILRADTAAVAALALVQAVRGDWRG
jgi:16S rRNA (uracil1498-N3)-methyltransferase